MRIRIPWMDVKLGLRMLVRHKGLSIVGGLGIAVGTALSAGSFAFFYSHLYPRLPLPEGDRIVALENWNVRINNEERRSTHDLVTWRRELRSITEIGAFRTLTRNLSMAGGVPESTRIAQITAAGLRAARVPPARGRLLTEDDEREGAPPVVVIGHGVWQSRFSSDPDVVGAEVRIGDTPHTVVGVMPPGFEFPVNDRFWTPLVVDPAKYPRGAGPAILVFGRLAPGATMEQAQAELTAIGDRTRAAFPATHEHLSPRVLPYTYPIINIQEIGAPAGFVAQAQILMSLVLIVVCANVAVLVYARTATRQAEIAVRTALGASRSRIVGQLFVEGLMLSGVAAAVGIAIAQYGLKLANSIMAQELGGAMPFWTSNGLATETILYVTALTMLIAVVVGVVPALQATGHRLQSGLRELGGGTRARLGRTWTTLIVGQVAVTVGALPAVAALAWNAVPAAGARPAFASQEFLGAAASAEPSAISDADIDRLRAELPSTFGRFQTALIDRLAAEPAVAGMTIAYSPPGREPVLLIEVEGLPEAQPAPTAHVGRVAPGFFETLGVAAIAGRTFRSGDERSRIVVVDRMFVSKILGGGNAIGRRLRYVRPDAEPGSWFEIGGVVPDLQPNVLDPSMSPVTVYHAEAPGRSAGGLLMIRVRGGDPLAFVPRLRELTASIDPSIRLTRLNRYDDLWTQDRLGVLLVAIAFSLITVVALLLPAAGIYALMSFAVTQRRREIGIRTALGAERRQVLASIFARAARQLAAGALAGAVLVVAIDPLAGGELLAGKGLVFVPLAMALMVVVGLAAAAGPARRALRIQPTSALREE